MHLHILGICGTFMGGLALLARQLGHKVTGSDANVYPPMSTQLEEQGIELMEGYCAEHLQPAPDLVVIGNALSRGNPAVEYVLEKNIRYTSGPQWLSEHLLQDRWVLACAGTHGKTTTSSLLSWLLEAAGMEPGFLIGGVPGNFQLSARLGGSPFFVIEADEYDSAFFDKRSKFVHYRPRTAILNNLEFDHADIFEDMAAIRRQFHHFVRTIPGNGMILYPDQELEIDKVLQQGCWTPTQTLGMSDESDWFAKLMVKDGSEFELFYRPQPDAEHCSAGVVRWQLSGLHNVSNAMAAVAAARHVGVRPEDSVVALAEFCGVKRRMELLGEVGGIHIYDDFAHHPTAIDTTLQGLRAKVGQDRVIAVIEPRSNTMRMGTHFKQLAPSTRYADEVFWYQPSGLDWSLDEVISSSPVTAQLARSTDQLIDALARQLKSGDHVVIMSNGGFEGVHQRLLSRLQQREEA